MKHLGFSVVVDSRRDDAFYEGLLADMLAAGVDAIELQLPEHDERMLQGKLRRLVCSFAYRSIHTSLLTSPEESREVVAFYHRAAGLVDAHALTVHTDQMQSWHWLHDAFEGKAQPENMDAAKKFGASIADVQRIHEELPSAKFTIDVNHFLTLVSNANEAPAMAMEFHQAVHVGMYHLSGFGGLGEGEHPHIGLDETPLSQQEILFACVQDDTAPIILETRGWYDVEYWRKDYEIAQRYLSNNANTLQQARPIDTFVK